MAKVTIIQAGMAGVGMKSNPLFLPENRLAGATNMQFDEGTISTRAGFRYHDLGIAGQFQGVSIYSPSRGLSHKPFADPYTAVVTAVGGALHYNLVLDSSVSSPVEILGDARMSGSDINIYQAENYLIAQGNFCDTIWWEGAGKFTLSPGLDADDEVIEDKLLQSDLHSRELVGANIACCYQKIEYCETVPILDEAAEYGSHDTLIFSKHRNYLINSAGIGIYTNGRVHQEGHTGIYVSDIIHKRGHKMTDDILLMEEQQAGSFGEPLSTNSRMGQLRALEVLPSMNTANGEGELIAYYDNGVVAFNTHIAPRQSVVNDETMQVTQKGWADQRQVSHMLNRVSAVGRYAVGVMPRDHAFRSRYGIHLLRTSIGEGTFNDEYTNTLAQDVQPILEADIKGMLRGTTVGHWTGGNRLLTSVGMLENELYTSSSMGKGFVVWNQATTFTEDRTPRPLWEGLWSVHDGIAGVHKLLDITEVTGDNMFGFVASGACGKLVFGEIDNDLACDILADEAVQIEWDLTSRKVFGGFDKIQILREGRVEIETNGSGVKVRVMVRTDLEDEWSLWGSHDMSSDAYAKEIHSINLGQPHEDYREASWYQFKIEGIGSAAVRHLEAEITEDRAKMGKTITTRSLSDRVIDYHKYNTKPSNTRWT